MPPKPKFTKEEIVQTALAVVSEKGVEALTAKELGDALGSSARPIFTVFSSMKEVHDAVREAAMHRFEHFAEQFAEQKQPGMPLFKQVGMQMIRFGIQEPKLYQLLFMQERQDAAGFDELFGALGTTAGACIDTIQKDYRLDAAQARTLFEHMWIYTFGAGTLCATRACRFSEAQLSRMLTMQFQAILQAILSASTTKKEV